MPGEQELELRDVPSEGSAAERPAAEIVLPVAAERGARARAYEAVRGQPSPALEGLYRRGRVRAGHAVDRPDVEQACLERDLECRHGRVAGGEGASCGES